MASPKGQPGVQPPPELQKLYAEVQKIQGELSELVVQQQQLESQLNENTMVKDEFEKLEESEQVYRLRGAVLIKQDVDDAKQAVRSRLDFIQSQLKKLEDDIEAKTKSRDDMADQMMKMQKDMVAAQQKQKQTSEPTASQ